MLLVTNLTLWMLLAVVFESYTQVRMASLSGPTAWAELGSFLLTVPSMAPRSVKVVICCGRHAIADRVSWSEVIAALTTGALKDTQEVSAPLLVRTLNMPPEAATALLREIQTDAIQRQLAAAPVPVPESETTSELQAPLPMSFPRRGISFGGRERSGVVAAPGWRGDAVMGGLHSPRLQSQQQEESGGATVVALLRELTQQVQALREGAAASSASGFRASTPASAGSTGAVVLPQVRGGEPSNPDRSGGNLRFG
jgi:hypothetical protein